MVMIRPPGARCKSPRQICLTGSKFADDEGSKLDMRNREKNAVVKTAHRTTSIGSVRCSCCFNLISKSGVMGNFRELASPLILRTPLRTDVTCQFCRGLGWPASRHNNRRILTYFKIEANLRVSARYAIKRMAVVALMGKGGNPVEAQKRRYEFKWDV